MSNIFPLGFESQVLGPEGPEVLKELIIAQRSATSLTDATARELQNTKIFKKINMAARGVEPFESIAALRDGELAVANAYYNGALISLAGLRALTNKEQRLAMADVDLPLRTEQTPEVAKEVRDANAKVYMTMGHMGFESAANYHDLFSDIEDEISPEVRTLSVAKAGFGLPFYLLATAIEIDAQRFLTQQAQASKANKSAWDDALAALLDNEGSI